MRSKKLSEVEKGVQTTNFSRPYGSTLSFLGKKLCIFLVLMGALFICAPLAHADKTSNNNENDIHNSQITVTKNITDTQNLLGSALPQVQDKIAEVEAQTKVHVELLYISSFGSDVNPQLWARTLLKDKKAGPNTVLLVVASNDGKLVVAVSANSYPWLQKESSVQEMSQAARHPLTSADDPQWSESAIALLDKILVLKETSVSAQESHVGSGIFVGVFFLLLIGLIFSVTLPRLRKKSSRQNKDRRKSQRKSEDKSLSENEHKSL